MARPGWPHRNPQTRFWIDEGEVASAVGLSYEVGALLFVEGFWDYCKEHVPTEDSVQFNGPWEGGRIDPPQIDAFIDAVRHWRSRCDDMEDTARGPWRWGLDGDVQEYVEATPDEIQEALRTIEDLARAAKTARASLHFET